MASASSSAMALPASPSARAAASFFSSRSTSPDASALSRVSSSMRRLAAASSVLPALASASRAPSCPVASASSFSAVVRAFCSRTSWVSRSLSRDSAALSSARAVFSTAGPDVSLRARASASSFSSPASSRSFSTNAPDLSPARSLSISLRCDARNFSSWASFFCPCALFCASARAFSSAAFKRLSRSESASRLVDFSFASVFWSAAISAFLAVISSLLAASRTSRVPRDPSSRRAPSS